MLFLVRLGFSLDDFFFFLFGLGEEELAVSDKIFTISDFVGVGVLTEFIELGFLFGFDFGSFVISSFLDLEFGFDFLHSFDSLDEVVLVVVFLPFVIPFVFDSVF